MLKEPPLFVLVVPSTTPFSPLTGLNWKVICDVVNGATKGICKDTLVSSLHPFLFPTDTHKPQIFNFNKTVRKPLLSGPGYSTWTIVTELFIMEQIRVEFERGQLGCGSLLKTNYFFHSTRLITSCKKFTEAN